MEFMFIAIMIPRVSPISVPMTPMNNPCSMNISNIDDVLEPSVRSMPMSLLFSITTIIRVLVMLKAATRTMKVRMMNIASFSCLSASKKACWSSYQVLVL